MLSPGAFGPLGAGIEHNNQRSLDDKHADGYVDTVRHLHGSG